MKEKTRLAEHRAFLGIGYWLSEELSGTGGKPKRLPGNILPSEFTKWLLGQKHRGHYTNSKEEMDNHLQETYRDAA